MNITKPGAAIAAATLLLVTLGFAGCSAVSSHLPWRHKAPPAAEVSTALTIATPEGAAVSWPQVWERNDVVLDLSGVSGSGSAVVMPRSGLAWPVRVALRVTPGSIGAIDVRGAQRVVVPVPVSGASLNIELPPGVYVAATKQITINWGPREVPAQ